MDNFGGGMNNMDRFGPSGMGRMNGKCILLVYFFSILLAAEMELFLFF